MPLRVLVAEDVNATREAIVYRLNEHPEIKVAGDFATVNESVSFLLEDKNIQALFLDIRLKDDYAWEILHQLNDNSISIPPVILITAEDERGYAETVFKNFKDEVVDYLIKPFDKKWRERKEECITNIKQRIASQEGVPTVSTPATYFELNEGSYSRIIPVEKLTHVLKIKEITEKYPIAGLYLFTTERPEPYYGYQYKAISRLVQKLASLAFIKGDRDNLIHHKHVKGFKEVNRQSMVEVGPFGYCVPLSEEGGKRLRKGMRL